MQVVAHFKLQCILRVAGGWVRDKIMGLPSHDIDIAIDDQMGKDFAEKLSEYMKESGRGGEIGSVGVIKSNPDQSKHLETATVRVLGFELDFVNLRAEEYTDSRIPVMRIGTAEEDALRRDLTINALFFNINERSVEDYTGRGMDDIKSRTVRTPLAAQANPSPPLPPLLQPCRDVVDNFKASTIFSAISCVLTEGMHGSARSANDGGRPPQGPSRGPLRCKV